jgi:hypothetical protein
MDEANRSNTGYGVVDVVVAAAGGAVVAGLLTAVGLEPVGAVGDVALGTVLVGTVDVLIDRVGVDGLLA